MNDKRIITQKELNYIETLYLYCNLEDFAEHQNHGASYAYFNMYRYIADTMLINSEFLGVAKGRSWYKFDNYRLGIMEYDKAKTVNQYNCIIQYEQHHMYTLDKYLHDLDLPFGEEREKYKIKRIDITKIAKHDEDYTENHGFISPYRTKRYEYGTTYLGHRKNGNVFRIYNKTKELLTDTAEHPIDYKKISLLSQYFGDIENLYTYELELSRSYLKNDLNIDNLTDLDKVYQAYKNIVGQIRIYKDTDRNKILIKSKNYNRIKALVLTDFVPYERVEKKEYKPSYSFLQKRISKMIDNYLDSGLEKSETEFWLRLIMDLTSERDIDGKEITFDFEISDLEVEKAQFSSKMELLRENQGNELEIEAKRAFGKIRVAKQKPERK